MPKSKRTKIVALSRTEKKGKAGKEALFTQLQEAIDEYKYIWVFRVDNMRNTHLKTVREEWRDSRILFGKTKVMSKAMGTSPEEEYCSGLYKLGKLVKGSTGILATNDEPSVVQSYFETFSKTDFARAGTISPMTFIVPEGPLYSRAGQIPQEEDTYVSHTMEPQLRSLGLPTQLKQGVLHVTDDYTVCSKDQVLDSRQTQLLKHFGVAFSEFKIKLIAYYDKSASRVSIVPGGSMLEEDAMSTDSEG